jgi:glycosyltransferase involved in cell wall biosynthesis
LPLFVQCHGSIGQIADHDPVAGQAADELLARLLERGLLSIVDTVQTHFAPNADFWRSETGREIRAEFPAWSLQARGEASEVGTHGLVVGRLQRWKGPSVVCEALQRLGQDAPPVDWYGRDTVWGSRRMLASEHLARLYPDVWGGRFIYHGGVTPAEVARLQSRASFNIIPSTWDVFNFTVAEAMASGRPTIVSTGAGASELVTDGVNGFLFPAGDADALADAIRHVLREAPHKLAALGQEARRTILEKLDPKAAALRRLEGYAATIKAFKSSPPKPTSGWLATACRPSGTAGHELSFLENVPISALLKHSAARISRRLRSR